MKHKKAKLTLFGLGVMLALTSCSNTVKPFDVSVEDFDQSVNYLLDRTGGDDDYIYRYNSLMEKYRGRYVSSKNERVLYATNASHPQEDIQGEAKENVDILLSRNLGGEIRYSIITDKDGNQISSLDTGLYTIEVEYYLPIDFLSAGLISVYIGNSLQFSSALSMQLPLLYEDDVEYDENGSKDFDGYVNKYGDQLAPKTKRYGTWASVMLNTNINDTSEAALFEINSNTSFITIRSNSESTIYLRKIKLVPYQPLMSYDEYYNDVNKTLGTGTYKLNAIDYAYKNDKAIRLSTEMTATVAPFNNYKKLINVLDGWDVAGQTATWKLTVDKAGLYPITLHYYNGTNEGPVFRTIEINGKVPFEEFKNYRFENTGAGYANETLSKNGKPLYYFFDANKEYELSITSEKEPFSDSYYSLMSIYDDINDFAIEIRKITGATVDTNRQWRLTTIFPETEDLLKHYKNVIYYEYNRLSNLVDDSSMILSYFPRMTQLLDDFIKSPNSIPNKLDRFSSGDSCLAKLIADTANLLTATNMTLDMIYLTNDDSKIARANASGWENFKNSVSSLFDTFTSDRYKTENDPDQLNVWVNRSLNYIEIMQAMADNDFTPKTGIKVNLRQMPGEQNLILANAANQTPDLALGVTAGLAFEFALRGDASYPLSDFDDFWEVAKNIPAGQFLSSLYQDKIYGLPETSTAQVLYARSDILEVIGDNNTELPMPEVWDDLINILPRLQSSGMNFYYPASVSTSLKPLSATVQLILQNGGKLYADDGFSVDLRADESIRGLQTLTDLYTIYALPAEVANFFNSFRYGSIPLGVSDISMYISLKYVAPELAGKWKIALPPGVRQNCSIADGTCKDLNGDGTPDDISRWYISNGSTSMIFNKSKKIDEAWEFNKWWMSTDVQIEYADTLQSIYGPSFVWFSANKEAAKELLVDPEVRDIMLEAQKWITDLQQLPGQYMIQRGLSDIWNTVVLGKSSSGTAAVKMTVANAVDLNKVIIDREIKRKMEEFGFYDTKTNKPIKEYKVRDYDWILSCIQNKKCPV